jgi:hypothetical protein
VFLGDRGKHLGALLGHLGRPLGAFLSHLREGVSEVLANRSEETSAEVCLNHGQQRIHSDVEGNWEDRSVTSL